MLPDCVCKLDHPILASTVRRRARPSSECPIYTFFCVRLLTILFLVLILIYAHIDKVGVFGGQDNGGRGLFRFAWYLGCGLVVAESHAVCCEVRALLPSGSVCVR